MLSNGAGLKRDTADGLFTKPSSMVHLQFSWGLRPVFSLPGQEGRRRRQKRPGGNLPSTILLPFRKETRREREGSATKRGSPHPAKEESPPFLASRMPFCPGMGPLCYTCNPLFSEPPENTPTSEREMLFCSIKSEMISINRPPRETCPPPGIFPPSDTSWVKTSPLPEFRHRFR